MHFNDGEGSNPLGRLGQLVCQHRKGLNTLKDNLDSCLSFRVNENLVESLLKGGHAFGRN